MSLVAADEFVFFHQRKHVRLLPVAVFTTFIGGHNFRPSGKGGVIARNFINQSAKRPKVGFCGGKHFVFLPLLTRGAVGSDFANYD